MSKKELTVEEKIIGSYKKVLSNPDMKLVLKDILAECDVNEMIAKPGDLNCPNASLLMAVREGKRHVGIHINERIEEANK